METVGAHCGFDAWVGGETVEEGGGAVWVGQVGEWDYGGECVGCFFLGLLPVAGSGGGGGFDDACGGGTAWGGAGDGGYF